MLRPLRKRLGASQAAAPRPSTEPIEGNALFEAMVCEFHWTALQIGGVTACMNAGIALERSWMLRGCSNLIPVQAPIIAVALRAWKDIGFARELASKIARVYFELADAKKMTVPLISSAGQFGYPAIPIAKLEQMAAVWRKLCDDCNETVQQLEPETRWRLSGLYTGNTLMLGKFLKDVAASGHSCVNTIGEVTLPVLPQRRRTQRYTLLQPCKILAQGRTQIGLAKEVSKSGMSIECEFHFSLKEPVTIELRNGRRMKGIVVWNREHKLGVQFENPLPEADPLVAA